MRPLAFVGRHATKFMAAGVLVGFVVPPLAALARPLLAPALVIPLALALVRLDWSAIAEWRRRPWLVAALVVFILGVSPAPGLGDHHARRRARAFPPDCARR